MSFIEEVQSNGFAIVEGVLTPEEVHQFQELMKSTNHTSQEAFETFLISPRCVPSQPPKR